MIKKILIPLLLSISAFSSESQLMFNDYGSYDHSGFITAELKMASINNSAKGYTDASTVGVYYYGTTVAMLFDNNFYGGGSIYTSGSDFLANGDVEPSKVGLTYMGGVFGISPNSTEQIHFSADVFLGLGYASDTRFSDADLVLVFEPEVSIEINLTNFTKFKLGTSWRTTQGVDANHATNGWFGSTFMSGYGSFPSINYALIFGEY